MNATTFVQNYLDAQKIKTVKMFADQDYISAHVYNPRAKKHAFLFINIELFFEHLDLDSPDTLTDPNLLDANLCYVEQHTQKSIHASYSVVVDWADSWSDYAEVDQLLIKKTFISVLEEMLTV